MFRSPVAQQLFVEFGNTRPVWKLPLYSSPCWNKACNMLTVIGVMEVASNNLFCIYVCLGVIEEYSSLVLLGRFVMSILSPMADLARGWGRPSVCSVIGLTLCPYSFSPPPCYLPDLGGCFGWDIVSVTSLSQNHSCWILIDVFQPQIQADSMSRVRKKLCFLEHGV